MPYQSNMPAITQRMRQAGDAGLIAAAEVGVTTMKQKLPPNYYTGGNYKTGNLLAHIARGEPFDVGPDVRAIAYGTLTMTPPYPLFWELGFMAWPSYFSEKLGRWVSYDGPKTFKRKEIWVPTFFALRSEFLAAYQRTYQRFMGGGATGQRAAASPRSPDVNG